MSTHYQELGVPADAEAADIRKAYLKLVRDLHPDKTGGDPAKTAQYMRVVKAYEVLSDPAKRSQYDVLGSGRLRAEAAGVVEKFGHAGIDAACDLLSAEAARRFPTRPKVAGAAKSLAELGKDLGRDVLGSLLRKAR